MTDEERLERKRAAEEDARALREADVDAVMRTVAGRRFVWDLLERLTGLHSLSYVTESDRTIFNEGQRSVGVVLLAELQDLVPHAVRAMVTECFTAEAPDKPGHETNQQD